MTTTKEGRVINKGYYSCPQCDNPQLREIIYRAGGQYDLEICSCGFPENETDRWTPSANN